MNYIKDNTYWIEHPRFGTFKAILEVVSTNELSLAFALEQTIFLQSPGGGGMMARVLLLIRYPDREKYVDIMTQTEWTIYDEEPKIKLPTK